MNILVGYYYFFASIKNIINIYIKGILFYNWESCP